MRWLDGITDSMDVGLGTHFRIHSSMPNVKVVALADIDPVKRTGDISSVVGNIGGGDNSRPLDLTALKSLTMVST